MKVHHLNCATMCPRGGKLLGGEGPPWSVNELVSHVLLIEGSDGLILVDTGFGTADCANPKRLGQPFRALVSPQTLERETAIRQIEGLGLDPADVRHIVATHLDVDHAGGLGDFPNASVHVFGDELDAAENPPLTERLRYIPEQWAHGPNWVRHELAGDEWFGFGSVRVLEGVDPEVAIVPVTGHSIGHSAVAVRSGDRWLLHCGDAYFHRDQMATPHSCPVGLSLFQGIVGHSRKPRIENQERLRELARNHGDEVTLFCSHDAHELQRLQSG